jgi:hypothetical protein
LAWGVNLPAHTVVIKVCAHYQAMYVPWFYCCQNSILSATFFHSCNHRQNEINLNVCKVTDPFGIVLAFAFQSAFQIACHLIKHQIDAF